MTYAIHIEKITNRITRHAKFWILPYTLLFLSIVSLNIASAFTGWFFVYDTNGYLHAGRFLYIPIILSFGYILTALSVMVRRRKTINISEFRNLVSVPIPIIVAGSLQSFFQMYPIILPGCVLSLFLVFANIQERRLSFDHLTGAYNRQKLDEFMEIIIDDTKNSGKPFAALLADVNHFKHINDNFGHTEGDKALITVVDIIRSCIRNLDFLARYAGDEFVVIFPNCEKEQLNSIIERINKGFAEYSRQEERYHLSISIGAAFYNPETDNNPETFIKRLDSLMYENKKEFHARDFKDD